MGLVSGLVVWIYAISMYLESGLRRSVIVENVSLRARIMLPNLIPESATFLMYMYSTWQWHEFILTTLGWVKRYPSLPDSE